MKLALAAVVSSLLLLSCGGLCPGLPCPECGPGIYLIVTDAVSGEPVTGLAISPVGTCISEATQSRCTVDEGAGEFDLTVTAPGHADLPVHVVVPADPDPFWDCCRCAYEPQFVQVELQPL